MEGYQKSNLKGEGLSDLHYGVIVKDIAPEFEFVKLQAVDVKREQLETAEFPLPTLESGERPVNSRVGFEGQTFPPQGWALRLLPGNVCRLGEIFRDGSIRWELELLRLGTRQTTALLRLDSNVVARINGDTTSVEPDTGCVGILHQRSGLKITLRFDQLFLTETPR